jgi:trehalose 6-phosphate synthase
LGHAQIPRYHHEIWDAWNDGYVEVNGYSRPSPGRLRRMLRRTGGDAAGLPSLPLRRLHPKQKPNAVLQHFVHIPWPDPDYWRLLPLAMRRDICEGMLGNDIVGFQTQEHARSFMYTCEAYVEGAQIDYSSSRVTWQGRHTEVRVYPSRSIPLASDAPPTARKPCPRPLSAELLE